MPALPIEHVMSMENCLILESRPSADLAGVIIPIEDRLPQSSHPIARPTLVVNTFRDFFIFLDCLEKGRIKGANFYGDVLDWDDSTIRID